MPVPGVQPAIWAPPQTVGRRVADAVLVDAIQNDLGRAVGYVVAVAVGNEQQVGQVQQPDTAEATSTLVVLWP